MQTPGTPPIPHVGGPFLPPGAPTVLISCLPAATLDAADQSESIYLLLEHLAANGRAWIAEESDPGLTKFGRR